MVLKHNKKRNVGLVYEFFSRRIGVAIIEGRDQDLQVAKDLIKKHFNKGTDISKELQLFKVLYESKVSSREMAIHVLNRVRESVGYQSQTRLDLEKTALIHDVNTKLGGDTFFNQNIPDYKTYATIQMVLNNWRAGKEVLQESLSEHMSLEEHVIERMVSPQEPAKPLDAAKMTDQDVDRLVVDIMTEKVNKKFGDKLTAEQKKIIQLYVFEQGDPEKAEQLTHILENMKTRVLKTLREGKQEFSKYKELSGKLSLVETALLVDYADVSKRNDDLVSFFLGLPTVEKELMSSDNTN